MAETQDGGNVLGFVYIDSSAGFTFEHYGRLDHSDGAPVAVPSELEGKARLIQRIGQDFPAHCLDGPAVLGLGLPIKPDTMQFYEDERPPGEHHASWAFHYNHIGASEIALTHVSKAIAAGYSSPSLTFEHAFALNATGEFDQTVSLLAPIAKSRDLPADTVAELAYAYLKQGKLTLSIQLYKKAVKARGKNRSTRQWEFARNIAAAYDILGNAHDRDIWLRKSEQYKPAEL